VASLPKRSNQHDARRRCSPGTMRAASTTSAQSSSRRGHRAQFRLGTFSGASTRVSQTPAFRHHEAVPARPVQTRLPRRLSRKSPKIDRSRSGGRDHRNIGRSEGAVPSAGRFHSPAHGGLPRPIDAPEPGSIFATASRESGTLTRATSPCRVDRREHSAVSESPPLVPPVAARDDGRAERLDGA
jgi:hypothetical protein